MKRSKPLVRGGALGRGKRLRKIGKRGRVSSDEFSKIRLCVLARDGHLCRRCKDPERRPLDVHHKKPRSRGGDNSMGNLVTLCRACHTAVHDHLAPDWRAWLVTRKAVSA